MIALGILEGIGRLDPMRRSHRRFYGRKNELPSEMLQHTMHLVLRDFHGRGFSGGCSGWADELGTRFGTGWHGRWGWVSQEVEFADGDYEQKKGRRNGYDDHLWKVSNGVWAKWTGQYVHIVLAMLDLTN